MSEKNSADESYYFSDKIFSFDEHVTQLFTLVPPVQEDAILATADSHQRDAFVLLLTKPLWHYPRCLPRFNPFLLAFLEPGNYNAVVPSHLN